MFVGRSEEINIIKETIQIPGRNVIVYGNRRVGKTTLVNQALKNSQLVFISFECLKSSLKNNVDALARLLFENGVFSTRSDRRSGLETNVSLNLWVPRMGENA